MAVVIQEFEMQSAPEPKAASPASGESSEGEAKPSAQEVENLLRRHTARCARVWAH